MKISVCVIASFLMWQILVFAGTTKSKTRPEIELSPSGWIESPNQSDVYERKISISQRGVQALTVKLRVVPRRPLKNLDEESLKRLTWLSSTKLQLKTELSGRLGEVTQYFRYDPKRDLPRNLDFYEVKAEIVK